jgi:hypothetical protein
LNIPLQQSTARHPGAQDSRMFACRGRNPEYHEIGKNISLFRTN